MISRSTRNDFLFEQGILSPFDQQAAAERVRQRRATRRAQLRLTEARQHYRPPTCSQRQFGHPDCYTVLDERGLILANGVPNESMADAIVEFLNG